MVGSQDKLFERENFEVNELDDEIRVDELCQRFLRFFYLDLVQDQHLDPEEASALAYGADYFLRDFIIADRCENIFLIDPQRVRQFAGNWYIVKNLEPNLEELGTQLRGIALFYRFSAKVGKYSAPRAEEIERLCKDLEYYRQRIESFWEISDDFRFWSRECDID